MMPSSQGTCSDKSPSIEPRGASMSGPEFVHVPIISSENPVVIQFVSNVVGSGETLSTSLSACPSGRSSCASSSEIEIEVLFQDADAAYHDDGCTASSRGASFRGRGEADLEAGGSARLLRAPSLRMEFVERDGKGKLKWSEMEEGFGLSSWSHGSNDG